MYVLSIDVETTSFMELSVSSTPKIVGSVLVDEHAIRYTLKSGKGAIPRATIDRIFIANFGINCFSVDIHTRGDEAWNWRMERNHPILNWLNLIRKSIDGKVELGYFECQADAEQFHEFLKKNLYPTSWSNG
ncbi:MULTISPECIES: hypothetical protein [unclassified Duganella]|uniref:hypothetical protein n=1 Tax=unclassified Duganella TaxID=2636909 RepID=UPI0012E3BC3D|nr:MULTISPECIES: hypothetical protein [unclassified Duganella]